jgi:6-phosphogluconolactonase/glucosamine-6-phosphate isomerase/deaminase
MGVFECLVSDLLDKKLDLSECIFVGLDEWVGLGPHDDGSCRAMMNDTFFIPAGILPEQIHFFDGLSADLQHEADRMNTLINKHHGLDIMLVGIGTNGHIAMNEPGTSFDAVAHVSMLAEETKAVGQKYFAQTTVLNKGITLGLKHVRDARLPILIANGYTKNAILKKALGLPPSEEIPASLFQQLEHGVVMVDAEAGEAI